MKEKRIYLSIVSFIILAFDIALIFVLNDYSVKADGFLYITSKCLAVAALTGVVLIGLCKTDVANYVLQYLITIAFQFLPLIIRYLSVVENGFTLSMILFFISLIAYAGVEFGLIYLNKKSLKASEILKGREIEVKEIDENE